MNRFLGRGGPFAIFHQYPALLRLGMISTCAETTWATLLFVLTYYFKDELLVGGSEQYIASKIALALMAFTGAETLLKYPMGSLADRYGPRRFVISALAVCSVTPILMTVFGYLTEAWWPIIPLRAIDGIAAAALWPAMSALMSRTVPREAKATAMSVFNGAYIAGLAVGPVLGLLLGYYLRTNLYVFPFTAALMMIGLAIALRSIPPETKDVKMQSESLREELAILRGHPMLIRMMGLYALSQVGVGILAATMFLYIADQFGIQQEDLPRLLPIPAIIVLAVAIPLGRLPDKIGQAKSVWVSYSLATIGMLCIAVSSLFAPVAPDAAGKITVAISPALLLFGAGVGLMIFSYILGTPAWLGLTSLQVDETRQARALSLMQTSQGVGVVCAYILVSSAAHIMATYAKVKDRIRPEDAANAANAAANAAAKVVDVFPLKLWFWFAAAIFILCLIGTLLYVKDEKHHDDDEASAKAPIEMKGL